jgi:hypothetical protein
MRVEIVDATDEPTRGNESAACRPAHAVGGGQRTRRLPPLPRHLPAGAPSLERCMAFGRWATGEKVLDAQILVDVGPMGGRRE